MYQPSELDSDIVGSIVMELVSGISLQTYINNIKIAGPRNPMNSSNKDLILNSAIIFCYNLLNTVKLMHSVDVYHNDLHNGNVIVTLADDKSINDFKIIDFGKMTVVNDKDNSDFKMLSNLIFSLLAFISLKYRKLNGLPVEAVPIVTLENAHTLDDYICRNLGIDLKSTNVKYREIYTYFNA